MLPQDYGYEDIQDLYPNLSLFLADDYLGAAPQDIEAAVSEASGAQWTADDMEVIPIIPLLTAIGPYIPTILSAAATLIPPAVQGVQSLVNRPNPPSRQPAPTRPPSARQPAPARPPSISAPPAPAAQSGGAAGQANSAMQLLTSLTALLPQVIQAVGSLSMGSAGRESIAVGNAMIPAESIVHMLKTLSEQVLEQCPADRVESAEALDFLRGEDGQFMVDPADPAARAAAVFQTLLGEAAAESAVYEQALYEQALYEQALVDSGYINPYQL